MNINSLLNEINLNPEDININVNINFNYIMDISSHIYDISNNFIIKNNYKFYSYNMCRKYFLHLINNIHACNDSVIYMFLLRRYNDIPLCKIGYTTDIVKRHEQLEKSIGCNLYLLLKSSIKNENCEKIIHKYIKSYYNILSMDFKFLEKTSSKEMYYFDPILIKIIDEHIRMFNSNDNNQILYKIEIEKTKQIELQTKQIEYIEITKQLEHIETTNQETEKTKQLELQIKLENEKIKLENEKIKLEEEKTKQLELQMKILKLQNKKKS